MGFDLSGKRALLSGTVDDLLIGAGVALADAGAQVMSAGESVASDMADPEVLREQIEGIGIIDILVFNAGWRRQAAFLDHSPADWDAALVANFETPIYLAQAAARRMIARGQGGRIIFVSGVESLMSFEGAAAAGTSLTMLTAMAGMMAVDLALHRITVNVVVAGWMEGERYRSLDEGTQEHIANGIPLGHPGAPAEIGAALTFIASDAATYITGAVLPVDGGYTLTRAPGKTMLEW